MGNIFSVTLELCIFIFPLFNFGTSNTWIVRSFWEPRMNHKTGYLQLYNLMSVICITKGSIIERQYSISSSLQPRRERPQQSHNKECFSVFIEKQEHKGETNQFSYGTESLSWRWSLGWVERWIAVYGYCVWRGQRGIQEAHSGQREQLSTTPEGRNSLVNSGNCKLCSVTWPGSNAKPVFGVHHEHWFLGTRLCWHPRANC